MSALTTIDSPYSHLLDYQFTGARFLARKKAALLGDDPGLGKSAQAIAACDMVKAQSVLVVCPASLALNWQREKQKFATTKFELTAVSYDKLARQAVDYLVHSYDALIIDEAHFLKSRDAKRTQTIYGENCNLVHSIAGRAKHVWLLSGTIMPNNPSELWTHLRALAPETIGFDSDPERPMPYWSYVKKYCKVRQTAFGWSVSGGKNLDELKAKLKNFMLRRRKEEVLKDLPPLRWDTLYVEGKISTAPTAESERIKQALEQYGVDGLEKIAPHVATLRRMTAVAKIDPTVRYIKEFLDYSAESIVVFAHHREVMDALYTELKEVAVMVRGDTPLASRQAAVDAFQSGEKRVFLGQIQAAGTGLTLTKASNMLMVEQSWVPAENAQAAMRIHRIGQNSACVVRAVTLAGSIDEDIQRALLKKAEVITEVLG